MSVFIGGKQKVKAGILLHASVKPVFFVCGKYNGVAGVLFSAPRKTDVFCRRKICRRDARPSPPNKMENFIKRQSSPSLLLCASRRAGEETVFSKNLPRKSTPSGEVLRVRLKAVFSYISKVMPS
jgi:hypothetical protein